MSEAEARGGRPRRRTRVVSDGADADPDNPRPPGGQGAGRAGGHAAGRHAGAGPGLVQGPGVGAGPGPSAGSGPGEGTGPGPLPAAPTPTPTSTTGRGSRLAKRRADDAAKNEVRRKLALGEYGIMLVDEGNPNQSVAWKKFGKVIDLKDRDKEVKFVQCRNNKCGLIKVLTSGRGNLADHNCMEHVEVVRPATVPQPQIRDFHMSLAGMCAGKLIPPALADAKEFKDMVQMALDMGAKYGQLDVNTIMPCANTLRKTVEDSADLARKWLVNKFKRDLLDGLCSGTVDGWDGGGLRKRKFYTQTLSTISEDFEMHDVVLFTALCDAESVTSPVIREALEENMEKLTLPLDKVHEVTDDAADIVAALEGISRSYCMDHATNLTVKKSLLPQLTTLDLYGPEGGVVVDKVAVAVRALKSSRDRKLTPLKSGLIAPPKTRTKQRVFSSFLPMLRSVRANFSKVRKALDGMGQGALLSNVSSKDILDVINVLTPIEAIGKRKNNTFQASQMEEVISKTEEKALDSELTKAVKGHVRRLLVPVLKIMKVTKKCKDIATLIKTSGMNDRLQGGTLKQEVETRWMSVLTMLRSFYIWPESDDEAPSVAKIDQVNNILVSKKREDLVLGDEEKTMMLQLIGIWTPFETAIKKFEASKEPTIQHVIPRYTQLKRHLQPNQADTQDMARYRAVLLCELEKKIKPNITLRHKMGLMFWPKFASLPNMSAEDQAEVFAEVRRLCKEQEECLALHEEGSRTGAGNAAGTDGSPSPSKRRRRERKKESDEEYDSLIATSLPKKDELDTYILMQDASVKSKDILSWWKERAAMFPILSRVARKILATPASSAAVERAFSAAGRLISSRRTGLSADSVDDLLLLHDFVRKFGMPLLLQLMHELLDNV